MDNWLEKVDKFENVALKRFEEKLATCLADMDDKSLRRVLTERVHLARLSFESMYNTGLIMPGLCEDAKPIIREIINEEYPLDTTQPNHRELAMQDLRKCGVTELNSTFYPARTTKEQSRSLISLVDLSCTQDIADKLTEMPRTYINSEDYASLHVIGTLRTAGEMFPGVEFSVFMKHLPRLGLPVEDSVYFVPHATFDAKAVPFGQEGTSHADRLGSLQADLVEKLGEPAYNASVRIIEQSERTRMCFYDQF